MQHPLLCGPPWRCQSIHCHQSWSLPSWLSSRCDVPVLQLAVRLSICEAHVEASTLSHVCHPAPEHCTYPVFLLPSDRATNTSNLVRAAFQKWRWRKRLFQIKKSWKKRKNLVTTELHFDKYKRNKVIPAGNVRPARRNNDHWKEDKMGSNLEPLTSDSIEILI